VWLIKISLGSRRAFIRLHGAVIHAASAELRGTSGAKRRRSATGHGPTRLVRTAAAEAGFRWKYILAANLVTELVEAADQFTLAETIAY